MKLDTNQWLPLTRAAIHAGTSNVTINNWYLAGLITAIDPWGRHRDRLYCVKDIDSMVASSKRVKRNRLTDN